MTTLSRTFLDRYNLYQGICAEVTDWLTTHVGPVSTQVINDVEWTYEDLGGKFTPTSYMPYRCGSGWIMILGDVITSVETPNKITHSIIQELLVAVDDDNAALQLKLKYF
jgi:hypothetical protein